MLLDKGVASLFCAVPAKNPIPRFTYELIGEAAQHVRQPGPQGPPGGFACPSGYPHGDGCLDHDGPCRQDLRAAGLHQDGLGPEPHDVRVDALVLDGEEQTRQKVVRFAKLHRPECLANRGTKYLICFRANPQPGGRSAASAAQIFPLLLKPEAGAVAWPRSL
jgi:hypothetical protein